jgi:tetratricopeptide (TPR) repeat protein
MPLEGVSMTTRFRSMSVAGTALVIGLSLGATGCGKYSLGSLKAQKSMKDANVQYAAQEWKNAATLYEDVLSNKPDYNEAQFYLANSYDNLYKPTRKGEAENDAYIQKAVEHYKKASETDPNPATRKLALQYLVAAYGADKLADPSQAEPIIKRMIELEPNDPTNYFGLSKLYEDGGRYDDAEQALQKAKSIKPNDPVVYTTLSGYYNRQGDFGKTMENLEKAAELDPKNPQGFHLMATFYEEKVRKDFRLSPAEKKDYSLKGIAAEDKALALNPNYFDAMIVKNILLRHQALVETKDPVKQKELLKEADDLRAKAVAIQKGAKAAGTAK